MKVENGWVYLEGEVEWNYQKEVAKASVEKLVGVKGVSNSITIRSASKDIVEQSVVEDALSLNWSLHDKNIKVEVTDHKVTLTGTVDSIYQKERAGEIAWAAPGIWHLNNELTVNYEFAFAE